MTAATMKPATQPVQVILQLRVIVQPKIQRAPVFEEWAPGRIKRAA